MATVANLVLPILLFTNLILLFVLIFLTANYPDEWTTTTNGNFGDQNLEERLSDRKCSSTAKCLDLRRCLLNPNGNLTIHVQPMIRRIFDKAGNSIDCGSSISTEFLAIREHFLRSHRYQPNPWAACLVLPGLDTLALRSRNENKFWTCMEAAKSLLPSKSNFLLLNFLAPSSLQFHQRPFPLPAIFASAQHSRHSFRPALDLAIPLPYPISFQSSTNAEFLPKSHSIDILVLFGRQNAGNFSHQAEIFKTMANGSAMFKRVQFAVKCQGKEDSSQNSLMNGKICEFGSGKFLSIGLDPLILSSKFVLISEAAAANFPPQMLIWLALKSGAIPVILVDQFVAPFHRQLDWQRFSFHFPRSLLPHVPRILQSQSAERIERMRRQGHRIFRQHFGTLEAILDSTAAALEDLVMPIKMRRTKWEWNNFGDGRGEGKEWMGTKNGTNECRNF